MHATLEIRTGDAAGKRITLQPGATITVGRFTQASVVIASDALMSNVHFQLSWDGATCRLRDLDSRFGTSVNKTRVTEAVLRDGDQLVAGQTTFLVRLGAGGGLPAHAPPANTAAIEPTSGPQASVAEQLAVDGIHARVVQVLREGTDPLYALLDAARNPAIREILQRIGEPHQSLYEGSKGTELADWAPYVMRLPQQSAHLETLVREGWGKSWGIYLTCPNALDDVRTHFRRFLLVKTEEGKELYFRFYDPRVLRMFLPRCTPRETREFFGPVRRYLLEGEQPQTLLKFTCDPSGARLESQALHRVAAG